MAKQRRIKGSIIEIKLENGYYVYAQDLDVDLLFFDYFSELPITDLEVLNTKKPLFFLGVYDDAITSGRWHKIGKLAIKTEYEIVPLKFIQDSINPKDFRIYNPNSGEISKATKDQCEGLECAAVWEAEHVENRLMDHFEGRPNKWVEQLKIKG